MASQNEDMELNIHLNHDGISAIRKEVSEYDYIRFAVADLYGVARGVIVPAKKVSKYLKSGLQCYSGWYNIHKDQTFDLCWYGDFSHAFLICTHPVGAN